MISRAKASEMLDLFSSVKRAKGWAETQMYAPWELGPTQVRLLEYLAEHNGVSQSQLAKATDTDKALTGRALQTLIDRGWLLRERSSEDARAYVLSLAPAGRKLVKELGKMRNQVIERLARTLDSRDVDDFRRIAGKLLAPVQ
ncbi:MarR family transcriptional regulator [Tunturiibacter empetritectus]|uniref:DNA-binding MarR family transcriptional regulator n=2 Tax=Tunturiibacter TaxID=3154218 RepID=A0A852VEZ1_9BACT|nr:MarR family transcriptional regulator [Edaphobacter lichenicola]NYF88162.1 DNA-binding MarR family transcriptional regulator [Edaphobacter lichenicola]